MRRVRWNGRSPVEPAASRRIRPSRYPRPLRRQPRGLRPYQPTNPNRFPFPHRARGPRRSPHRRHCPARRIAARPISSPRLHRRPRNAPRLTSSPHLRGPRSALPLRQSSALKPGPSLHRLNHTPMPSPRRDRLPGNNRLLRPRKTKTRRRSQSPSQNEFSAPLPLERPPHPQCSGRSWVRLHNT